MMTPEIWVVIAVVLLGLAAVSGGLEMAILRGRWDAVVFASRVAALAALVVALVAAAIAHGQWSAADPRQAMLGLVAAMLAIHLLLAWRRGAGTAGPVVDLAAIVLSLVGAFVVGAGSSGFICVQLAELYQAQWILLSVGGGSVLVAACAGLMLLLRKGLLSRDWGLALPGWSLLYGLLAQAVILALAALGSGLVIGVWWAWRILGTLGSDSAREVWMAVAWLITAMSVLAWQLDTRRSRWAAALVLVAAIAVLIGLLLPVDLPAAGI
jgi:hypothetical protein